MTGVIPSSSAELIADPKRLLDDRRAGRIVELTNVGYMIATTADIVGLKVEQQMFPHRRASD